MKNEAIHIQNGITIIPGQLSRNLLFEPMVSNCYIIEDRDDVIIFDPACGEKTARLTKAHIRKRQQEGAHWTSGTVIAGHSHMDHANNFEVADNIGTKKISVYMHETGFLNKQAMNMPNRFIAKELNAAMKQYNVFQSFFFPYNLLLLPLNILSGFAPYHAVKLASYLTSLPMPRPRNGKIQPHPLREKDLKEIKISDDIILKGWALRDNFILPTPGHSPCSVSLLCPKQKAIFTSDAAWLGNPVFLSGSVKDGIASLTIIKELAQKNIVELLLPAHGGAIKGRKMIVTYLDFHIQLLESIREEVIACFLSNSEKLIQALARELVRNSPLFHFLKGNNYPNGVVFVNNLICVCLKEAGLR
ncbi:MAG: hypothetical protein A2277_06485 [Desulfobacterales bacterium RIFOXYA12_FULL_46_15]|nr:MAG: hypothetical protein A2277_06485 [Desulfobacterales bacterium RIFOXYA12_FULL_46_15]